MTQRKIKSEREMFAQKYQELIQLVREYFAQGPRTQVNDRTANEIVTLVRRLETGATRRDLSDLDRLLKSANMLFFGRRIEVSQPQTETRQ